MEYLILGGQIAVIWIVLSFLFARIIGWFFYQLDGSIKS